MNLSTELKERIHLKLIEFPELRDNDNKLISKIWKEDLLNFYSGPTDLETVGIKPFFLYLECGMLTSSESCRRYRQMIQEKHPELRGKNYLKRHKFAEEVKEEIINSK